MMTNTDTTSNVSHDSHQHETQHFSFSPLSVLTEDLQCIIVSIARAAAISIWSQENNQLYFLVSQHHQLHL